MANNKNVNFPTQFCLGSISQRFDYFESKEVSFKGNVYDLSVDYDTIDKSKTSNIYNYSMVKSNIKQHLDLLNEHLLYY